MTVETDFAAMVTHTQVDGNNVYTCNSGLFEVSLPGQMEAIRQAMYYFKQYWEDGEYLTGQARTDRLDAVVSKVKVKKRK